jgi:hypothetical protein
MESTEKDILSSPEERRHMIAEAAYFRAEKRGFVNGDPVEDWILAERQIDEALGIQNPDQKKDEMAAYVRMRREVMRMIEGVRGTVSVNTIRQTLDKASRELKGLGVYTVDTVNKAAEAVMREITSRRKH